MTLELVAATVVDERRARELAANPGDATRIVVADLIGAEAREVLRDAGVGWLDRRGNLHVHRPGLWIDRDVGPVPRHHRNRGPVAAIRGRAAMAVAVAHLVDPDTYGGVRPLARRLGLSPSAVSQARTPLADRGLLADAPDARARALLGPRRRVATGVARPRRPRPTRSSASSPAARLAAAALGAPIIATDDYPLELHCADGPLLQRLRLRNDPGPSQPRPRPARVAVAPTMLVNEIPGLAGRRTTLPTVAGHPIAHPLFVALDLAADPARGAEALADWEPEGWPRAW